ncbi:hypothetical protein H6P81_021457 [Aristolochia fimbriata]|uniref:Uncharacterized protein n=1 Tax=Aristolochia fimbriata TaxID=158543 RepID=A0AAV7DPU9_ARIFI|nr:hypothetical protein H6P81_021457 [Aristolochia fimbriata]
MNTVRPAFQHNPRRLSWRENATPDCSPALRRASNNGPPRGPYISMQRPFGKHKQLECQLTQQGRGVNCSEVEDGSTRRIAHNGPKAPLKHVQRSTTSLSASPLPRPRHGQQGFASAAQLRAKHGNRAAMGQQALPHARGCAFRSTPGPTGPCYPRPSPHTAERTASQPQSVPTYRNPKYPHHAELQCVSGALHAAAQRRPDPRAPGRLPCARCFGGLALYAAATGGSGLPCAPRPAGDGHARLPGRSPLAVLVEGSVLGDAGGQHAPSS